MSDLIEPSNSDYGDTPDSVRDYIHGLEQQAEQQQQRIDELELHVIRMVSGIQSNCYDDSTQAGRRLIELAESAPATSLVERDARVIDGFCKYLMTEYEFHPDAGMITQVLVASELYSDKLRQQIHFREGE